MREEPRSDSGSSADEGVLAKGSGWRGVGSSSDWLLPAGRARTGVTPTAQTGSQFHCFSTLRGLVQPVFGKVVKSMSTTTSAGPLKSLGRVGGVNRKRSSSRVGSLGVWRWAATQQWTFSAKK